MNTIINTSLFTTETRAVSEFSLALLGGNSLPQDDARIAPRLLNQAYSELVSAYVRSQSGVSREVAAGTSRYALEESLVDGALDGVIEPIAGAEVPSGEEELNAAINAVWAVQRYGRHVAAIEGNQWLLGFQAVGLQAADLQDEEAHIAAWKGDANMALLQEGRLQYGVHWIPSRLPDFETWRKATLGRAEEGSLWAWKLHLAAGLKDSLFEKHYMDIETTKVVLNSWLGGVPYGDKTRLEVAVERAANAAWQRVFNAPAKRQMDELRKLVTLVAYSPEYAAAREAFKLSPEYAVFELEQEVRKAEREAANDLRQALSAQAMAALKDRAAAVEKTRADAAAIRAALGIA